MHIPHFMLAGLNYTNSSNLLNGVGNFTHGRSSLSQAWAWITTHGHDSIGGFNYTNSSNLLNGVGNFTHGRSSLSQAWTWIPTHGHALMDWLEQPHILALIMAWSITFTVVFILLSGVGFNAPGIGVATLAAAFQSWVYGGFTPAGSIFATLTSMGMLGALMPVQVGVAAVVAGVVALVVWECGVGR